MSGCFAPGTTIAVPRSFTSSYWVVWLLAYGLHRSGDPDDFFPPCKRLDAEKRPPATVTGGTVGS